MWLRCTFVLAASLASACGGAESLSPDASSPGASPCERGASWSTAPAVLGGPIQETAVVELDGRLYVLGGFNASSGVLPSVRIYDAATCTWSDGPELPRAVHHVNAAVAGGTLYVLGSMQGTTFTPTEEVWAWNPSTDAGWTPRARMPEGTQRASAVVGVIDGRIYVAGGLTRGASAAFSAYSIADDAWDTTLPPLPRITDHACGGVIGGKLYVVGGRAGSTATNSAQVFEYTPGGDWVKKTSMPTPRGGTACGIHGDRIVVVGGEGNRDAASGVFSSVEAYTVSADRWDSLDPMPTPRHGMGAAVIDGVLYVPGGASRESFSAVATHEALRL